LLTEDSHLLSVLWPRCYWLVYI